MRMVPRGSFLIRGFMTVFMREISEGFSSFIQLARCLVTKTISFLHQLIPERYVSKAGFPRSSLHASMMASEWSLMAQYSFRSCFNRYSKGLVF